MKTRPHPKVEQGKVQAKSPNIPKQVGGAIIRKVIKDLRAEKVSLPLRDVLGSQILIACSGGLDSTALAVLIARYGTKIAPKVGLLHVNHGWRGAESDEDARCVERLASHLGVTCAVEALPINGCPPGSSPEQWARDERKKIYRRLAGSTGVVFTGHQADEVCETLLWRLFTGSIETHGKGILVRDGIEIRPFLRVFKSELRAFLEEEGVQWREDSTNSNPAFLRGGLRTGLIPELDQHFPKWRSHILKYSNQASDRSVSRSHSDESSASDWLSEWFGQAGVRTRRVHWDTVKDWLRQIQEKSLSGMVARSSRVLDSIDLEKGWRVQLEVVKGQKLPRLAIVSVLDQKRRQIDV